VIEFSPLASLAAILAGRLALGLGDSLFLTGAMAWGVQLAGPQNAGKGLMSVGIALYAAMAFGAPFGIAMVKCAGFGTLALIVAATPLVASYIAFRLPAQPVVAGARIPLREVFGRIWRPGAGVALAGVGFADGRYLYVGNFVDGNIDILRVDGDTLTKVANLALPGHPASMRSSTP
jgi:predicted MFS family arabinose efflux permease